MGGWEGHISLSPPLYRLLVCNSSQLVCPLSSVHPLLWGQASWQVQTYAYHLPSDLHFWWSLHIWPLLTRPYLFPFFEADMASGLLHFLFLVPQTAFSSFDLRNVSISFFLSYRALIPCIIIHSSWSVWNAGSVGMYTCAHPDTGRGIKMCESSERIFSLPCRGSL